MNEIDRPYNLKRFYLQWQKLNHVYEDYAKTHELTYISMFILQLLDREGTIQKELCDTLYFPKQTVNKVILSFVKRGYAAMAENPKDRRSRLIVLTEKGKEFQKKVDNTLQNRAVQRIEEIIWQSRRAMLESIEERERLITIERQKIDTYRREIFRLQNELKQIG